MRISIARPAVSMAAAFIIAAGPQQSMANGKPNPAQSAAEKAVPSVGSRSTPSFRKSRMPVPAAGRRTASPVPKAPTASTREPRSEGYVNAMQLFPFSEGAVYHVYTSPGRVTDIALQPGEALGAVAAGDTARWTIGDTTSGSSGAGEGKRTHVLVKPFAAGLNTNLVITTDKRAYHLMLTSLATPGMVGLAWTYPQDELLALRKASEKDVAAEPVAASIAIDALNFGYAIKGDMPSWRPLRAFDDGRQTFIEFPATLGTGEAPPLFAKGADGSLELVNYRLKGHFYIVDRLFDIAELRLGTKDAMVVSIVRERTGIKKRRGA